MLFHAAATIIKYRNKIPTCHSAADTSRCCCCVCSLRQLSLLYCQFSSDVRLTTMSMTRLRLSCKCWTQVCQAQSQAREVPPAVVCHSIWVSHTTKLLYATSSLFCISLCGGSSHSNGHMPSRHPTVTPNTEPLVLATATHVIPQNIAGTAQTRYAHL